jgi:hypothetical protein
LQAPDVGATVESELKMEIPVKSKLSSGRLSHTDFDAITAALEIPKSAPKADIALSYRNKLVHHIRPSVDSFLQSRTSAEVRDAEGKLIGMNIAIYSRPAVEYRFQELHAAFSEYLDAMVLMLEKLSKIEIVGR